MHEYHAIESAVHEITKKAREHGAKEIRQVTLVVGKRLGFAEESIRTCFEAFTDDELFENTKLVIKPADGREFYIDHIVTD